MFESKDSDITNLKKCAEYCFAFKEYSSGHLHLFFVFLMLKCRFFIIGVEYLNKIVSAKTVSVLFIYTLEPVILINSEDFFCYQVLSNIELPLT